MLQRVTSARVSVAGEVVGEIGCGILALVGVAREDGPAQADRIARKIAELRIMREELSVLEAGGEVLLVSQFTLYGDTRKGRRPSWTHAAPGQVAEPLIDDVAARLRDRGLRVATGSFGADMSVELVNDGPVTVIVEA